MHPPVDDVVKAMGMTGISDKAPPPFIATGAVRGASVLVAILNPSRLLQATVNRLVAGSSPARGAKSQKGRII